MDEAQEPDTQPFHPSTVPGAHAWFAGAVRHQEDAEMPIAWPDRPDIYWCAGVAGGCDTWHREDYPWTLFVPRHDGPDRLPVRVCKAVALRGLTGVRGRRDLTPYRLATLIQDVEKAAEVDPRARDRWEDAARALMGEVRDYLSDALGELQREQTRMAHRREAQGRDADARDHAVRARTHGRDRVFIEDLLGGTS